MRILGIDPGLGITGYGLIEAGVGELRLLEAGVIRTSSNKDIGVRINKIYIGVKSIIEEFKPRILVLERLYSHYKHPTTAILMGHSRGVICLLAEQFKIQLVGYSATRIKKAITGSGHASKHQIQCMMRDIFNLKVMPEPPDVSDALALAAAHAHLSQKEGIVNSR